ncbi:transposase (plasmid) [Deinococcus peraridilitoris DSM 19664]|uniref:Transposase n=1 Tax=Deinococcus peraridilitoris (strain DSM 19664 / LMG 22246 / CIP 109416 / KR-200) TaxID=937777 RepID=L0A4Y1_DEIPD|nr:transposase [Deinococcus peraridilitoris DSM 19664]AFZ68943.1 transposase [Deinococcus peraridilitoris DSM 19664]AFZ69427.1 transposase [Deinococcus peraridilitoris DSM 19664]
MTNRKVYTAEFKRDAVNLAESTGNVAGTARDLGISDSVLRKWIKAAQQGMQAFPGQGRQHLTPEQQEIKRLRQENEILRQEREILKKAAACLGQNGRP